MCQRIPLVLTPFLWAGPAAGGTGLYKRHRELMIRLSIPGEGGSLEPAGHPGLRLPTHPRHCFCSSALPCDEQVKPGEFHLKKISTFALVVYHSTVFEKKIITYKRREPSTWTATVERATVTLSDEFVTISENKPKHTDFFESESEIPMWICTLLIL